MSVSKRTPVFLHTNLQTKRKSLKQIICGVGLCVENFTLPQCGDQAKIGL